jgi:pimeloyl-ACP methyl ester carboxylesterase
MKTHQITGGGGVQLHVVETGNPKGRPILFIPGLSQCWLAWNMQLNSNLAEDHRLVAMDLRGHGLSDKPADGYADSKMWADDINAIVQALSLNHPVLSGWSYGPLVILDYIRHYGEGDIGGINFVGGITKLGSEEAMSVITPEFLAIVPDLFSTNVEESVCGLLGLLRMCFRRQPAAEDLYRMLGYNVSVPPSVRQALFSRSFHNDDLLPKIRKPAMITQGAEDLIVKRSAVDQHKAGMPHAQIHIVENAGHAPFWDDPDAFNQRLRMFCSTL